MGVGVWDGDEHEGSFQSLTMISWRSVLFSSMEGRERREENWNEPVAIHGFLSEVVGAGKRSRSAPNLISLRGV